MSSELQSVGRRLNTFLLIIFILSLFYSPTYSFVHSGKCTKQSDCGGSDIKYKACIDNECTLCESDDECTKSASDVCNSNGYCSLAGFFEPFTFADFLGAMVILLGAMIAAGGGLGGGGIFIPVYILILSMGTASAAALSQATIFGGSIVNFVMNFKIEHPRRKHRPLPDLYTILIFEPMLLGGTIIGVIFNVILPDPITLSLLVITLGYASIRTMKRGVKIWRRESERAMKSAIDNSGNEMKQIDDNDDNNSEATKGKNEKNTKATVGDESDSENDENNNNNTNNSNENIEITNDNNNSQNDDIAGDSTKQSNNNSDYMINPKASETNRKKFLINGCGIDESNINNESILNNLDHLIELMKEESKIKEPLLIMLAMWLIVSLFSLLRRFVDGCSFLYWLLTFGIFPFLFFLAFYLSKKQVIGYQNKLKYGWVPAQGDIHWKNNKQAMTYSAFAGLAGFLGGLLGIGGGMIVSPLLLELFVLPRVASATSAMAVLVTSSSATLQFLLIDMLAIDYMLFFMSIGIVGTFLGQTIVNYCIRKYGRVSVVVLSIGTVIALAVILMGLKGIVDIINGDSSLIFSSLC